MQTKFRFNKATIDQISTPEKRLRLRDTGVEGLVLELSPSGTQTFRVYKKIKGQSSPVTVTLGKYPGMSIENARQQARAALSRIGGGENPNEVARSKRQGAMTLRQVYDDYMALKTLSDSTRTGYKRIIETYLKAYQNKPLNRFTGFTPILRTVELRAICPL